jgi:thioesterase domain-containing protein
MGGIVAFEMARQLKVQGQEIALLGLLDATTAVVNKKQEADEMAFLYMFVRDLGFSAGQMECPPSEQFVQLEPDEQLAALLDYEKSLGVLPPDVELTALRHLLRVFKENVQAMWRYTLFPCPSKITLFRASEKLVESSQDVHLGWGKLASGGVDEYVVPGNHYTILREPNVSLLATHLKEAMSAHSVI